MFKTKFLILYSPKNTEYRSKLAEKLKFNVPLKIVFLAFWAPCISKMVRDRKNRLNNSESSHLEESNEKNPIKFG